MAQNQKTKKKFEKDWQAILGTTFFGVTFAVVMYILGLFPGLPLYVKLIPVYIFLLVSIIIFSKNLKTQKSSAFFIRNSKKLIFVVFAIILFSTFALYNLTYKKVDQKLLINKYLNFQQSYWKEIRDQLNGPLASRANLFPDFYRNAGNQLIFPAADGLVSVTIKNDFSFDQPQFNSWLRTSQGWYSPSIKIITSNLSGKFSISQWVPILTGNGIKVEIDNNIPQDIFVKGNFPSFPGIQVYDPATNIYGHTTLFTIKTSSDSISEFSCTLREISMQEEDTHRMIYPFAWRQLDIYGNAALEKLDIKEAQLLASRELGSVLAGLNLGIENTTLNSNPVNPVQNAFGKIISDFSSLLSKTDQKEAEIQNFLKQNPILISPTFLRCIPQAKLGSEYITDFVIEEPATNGSRSVLVEIESPNQSIFTKSADWTPALHHAIKRVSDLRNWLRANATYAISSLQVKDLSADSPAIIVIGRKGDMSKKNLEDMAAISKDFHYQTEVITYDDILERSITWYNNLKKVAKRFL